MLVAVKRRLFTASAGLSLLLCLVMIVLWVRSYWVWDAITQLKYLPPDQAYATSDFKPTFTQRFTDISSVDGEQMVAQTHRAVAYNSIRNAGQSWGFWPTSRQPIRRGPSMINRIGFAWTMDRSPAGTALRVLVPLWFFVLAGTILPSLWLKRRHRDARRIRLNLCSICGYDLRATPNRCPECGAVPMNRA
jgi:hypothetical protein